MNKPRATVALALSATLSAVLAFQALLTPSAVAAPAAVSLSGPAVVVPEEVATLTVTATGAARAGDKVSLEHLAYGIHWYTARSTTLDSSLRASFTVTQKAVGSYRYRARLHATSQHSAAASATYTLTVVSTTTPPPSDPADSTTGDPRPSTGPDCGGARPVKANGQPWVCTYNDEFNGTSLDRSKWVPQVTRTSRVVNGTHTLYTCYDDRPDVIGVRNGNLELSMVRLPAVVDCGQGKASQYVAGQVSHFGTFSQTYGKYEVRAQFPATRERGLQSAIWMWPDNPMKHGAWPLSGEIDIAESYSRYPDHVIPYMHYLAGPKLNSRTNVVTGMCRINHGEFNTYGLEWKPKQLKIFVNGTLCIENNYSALNGFGSAAPFDHPFFLALTQMMGTTGNEYDSTKMPAVVTTKVDYARIWK